MKKFIGNKDFYRLVAVLALPLLLQNAVSTFVNLLDNLMVGRIGTESMSGVSIVNQLLFVYNLCLFGGSGGAGIFGAQFFGRGDYDGVRHTLRFNILLCAAFTVFAAALLALIPDALIYLRIMLFGLPAFCLTTAYVSILRVTGDNRLPMKASLAAIFVNLAFNYLLIYGKLGFPALGVRGAAAATVLSRYVELGLILRGTHGKRTPPEFIRALYRGFSIPRQLAGQIIRKGMPLLVNEMFWSLGMTMLTQCYSYRGLDAVAALNINSTVLNLFNTVIFTMGNTVGIVIGNLLGAEEYDRARDYCPKLAALSCAASAAVGAVLFLVAPYAPRLYNTSHEIMTLAASLMRICALMLPVHAIVNASYWTIRAGGRTYITMLSDSVFTWVVSVSIAWVLIHKTGLPLVEAYLFVNLADLIKMAIGIALLRRGIWVRNIVTGEKIAAKSTAG